MKTDDLIALLASDPLPPASRPWYQPAVVLALGLAVALLAVAILGINPHLALFATLPSIATKLMWLLALAVAATMVVRRLARPGWSAGAALWLLPVAWLAMAGLGVAESWGRPSRVAYWMGSSWQVCPVAILGLSLPLLAALIWSLRDLATTRPALTGAISGVLAGSLAAVVYSLHCTETAFGFFTLWYGGGIALSGLVGVAAGHRWLRW